MGIGDWGLEIGDWELGIGDWAQSPIPNPQSPIPNPQSPNYFELIKKNNKNKLMIKINKIINLILFISLKLLNNI